MPSKKLPKKADFSAVLQGDGNYRPGRIKTATSLENVDSIFSGDPVSGLMPHLRQIHKMSNFPTGSGPEDWDAMKQPPNNGKSKESQGFEYAETGPNAGETGFDPPRVWRPGKLKHASGLLADDANYPLRLSDAELMANTQMAVYGPPSMAEQYYMGQMGGSGSEESMPLELVSMAGPGAAQGAQMAQMAKRLAQAPNQRLAQRAAAREVSRAQIVRALALELAKLQMEKKGYKLQGHTDVQGLPIAIENRKGSVRTGTDSDGNEWRTKMVHPYGYIVGTKGVDGDPVDAYVGPNKDAPDAYVVHQHKDDGTGYDEDKVMLGFKNKVEAKKAYLAHYDDPKFLGPISRVSIERLKELVASKKRLVKISQASYAALLRELSNMEKQAYELSPRDKAAITNTNKAYGALGGGALGALGGGALGALAGRVLARDAALGGALGVPIGMIGGGMLGSHLGRKRGREKWKALEQMPGENQLGDPSRVKLSGVITNAEEAGIIPAEVADQLKRSERIRALRKAGPGIGGALGAGVGALVGLKRGGLLKSTLTGLGTGATLGWIPDMGLSAKEAIQRYKRTV